VGDSTTPTAIGWRSAHPDLPGEVTSLSGQHCTGPSFVVGHIVEDVELFRDECGGLLAVIDSCDQRAVLVLVIGDKRPVLTHHVPPLAEH
jgi:hypothetical protein